MTRSGRLLRLRRTAHEPPRRGPCWSPCPRLRLAGSTPFGDVVPHCLRQRLPLWVSKEEGFFKRALAQAPQGQSGAGEDGDLLANRHRNPQPPRGRNACYGVLREGLRGRKRSVPGTAKPWQAGTPFLARHLCFRRGSAIRACRWLFWRLGGTELSLPPLACAVGQIWGLGEAVSGGWC